MRKLRFSQITLLGFLERHLVRVVVFCCLAAIAGSTFLTLRNLQQTTTAPAIQTAPRAADDSLESVRDVHKAKTSLEDVSLLRLSNPFERSEP